MLTLRVCSSMAPWSQRPPGRRPQRGGRGSYVPDHVRNPGKYTCYALDEPLTVGGGGGGGAAADDAEQVTARFALGSRLAAVTRIRACGAGCACRGMAQSVSGKTGCCTVQGGESAPHHLDVAARAHKCTGALAAEARRPSCPRAAQSAAQVQAARAAQTAAAAARASDAGAAPSGGGEEAARADLPAFGGGIEFRPRAARVQPGGGGGGGGAGSAGGPKADRLGGGDGSGAMALEAEGPAAGEVEEVRPALLASLQSHVQLPGAKLAA